MKKERNALAAGVFMILTIVLIFAITILIKGVSRFDQAISERQVQFALTDNIGGLRIGDDVRVGGLKVGIIKSIDLIPQSDRSQHIVISFTIPTRIELHKNAHMEVESTVTGTADLNIDSLGDGALLADKEPLVGSPGSLTTILASAKSIMPLVHDTIADVKTQTLPRINATIDDIRPRAASTLDKFGATADTGKDALAQIRDLFGDTKSDFRGTMKNLNSATATVDKKLPAVMDDIHEVLDKAKGTVDSITVALEDVKKTVANTRDITASGRSIISGNKSKFDAMIASLKIASDNLKAATTEIRHSPWRLLYKPAPGEVANLNLYDTARQFSEGASNLDDAASALRDALKDPNADKAKVQMLEDELDKSFENFNQVEDDLWKSVKQ
jgi:phospholipid/cholesterol/gamma-HCH transport system substrate-binding protein